MIPIDSQFFDSYVPVYDEAPEKWEDGRAFIVEQFKRMANAINIREIGWFLDQELLSGKAFIPGILNKLDGDTSQQYRSILRKVVNVGPLVAGANAGVNHGIFFDANFTLIDIWVAGTNSNTLTALNITGNNVVMNATQIVITSPQVFTRAYCVIEYIQEL
jgi:hypothetical protein